MADTALRARHPAGLIAERAGMRVVWADTPEDRARALALRSVAFRQGLASDEDAFDAACAHLLILDAATGQALACCRARTVWPGDDLSDTYTGQVYGLSHWPATALPALELGRVCHVATDTGAPALRLLWAGLTDWVDRAGIRLLFGCASFDGTDASRFQDALSCLARDALAPATWQPQRIAAETLALHVQPGTEARAGLSQMPALLRGYLAMGGWVSDHAVIDRDLKTTHVLTGVDVAQIPAARARSLRALLAAS